jgi:hypothetical protein
MEEIFSKIENLLSHLKEYADNRVTIVKLTIAEKVSRLVANVLAGIFVLFVFFFFIIFASITLAILLSMWIGKMYAGFLIVTGLYFLAGIIIWMFREKLLRLPIMNAMINQLFEDEDEEV